ncbi:hypothetical protein ACWC9Q_34950 [Streptomyces sp. NPDC001142]
MGSRTVAPACAARSRGMPIFPRSSIPTASSGIPASASTAAPYGRGPQLLADLWAAAEGLMAG